MKRLLPSLVLLLLLTACGVGEGKPAPTPETPPSLPTPVLSPAPAGTPENWGEEVLAEKLPLEPGGTYEEGKVSYTVAAALPQEALALYQARHADEDLGKKFLRYGDSVQCVGTMENTSDSIACPLFLWADFDGDGANELATVESVGRQTLTLYEWGGSVWTPRPYDDFNAALQTALTLSVAGSTATLSYGVHSASYTLGHGEKSFGPLADFADAPFIAFDVNRENGLTAVFGASILVDGEPRSFASVTADVEYDGQGFTLRNLQMISIGGV